MECGTVDVVDCDDLMMLLRCFCGLVVNRMFVAAATLNILRFRRSVWMACAGEAGQYRASVSHTWCCNWLTCR